MVLHDRSIDKAGLDYKKIKSLATRLSKIGLEAEKMGITIFGGSGSGSMRIYDPRDGLTGRPLIVAQVDGSYDGGDGACWEDEDGCMRGE